MTKTRAVGVLATLAGLTLGAAEAATVRDGERLREPAPHSETEGIAGFREFAAQIDRAVAARDAQFFIDRARLARFVCTNDSEGLVEPRCVGQPDGAVIDGVWRSWWKSEGVLLSAQAAQEDLSGFLRASDQPTLQAIGDQTGHVSDFFGLTNAFFAVIASSDEPTGSLWVLTFEFSKAQGRWQTAMVMEVGTSYNEEWLSGTCADCYAHLERWRAEP